MSLTRRRRVSRIKEIENLSGLPRHFVVVARRVPTHRLKLDQIERAYDLFANQRDGVLKVAIMP